jgi:uncharacterized membrane protein
MKEKHYRSVIKGVSYRIFGTLTTMVISYLVTGKAVAALSIGVADVLLKTVIYYFHERAWNKIAFGKIVERDPEYTI